VSPRRGARAAVGFVDEVLPGFEQPEPTVRTRTKKQEADALKVSWVRHTASPRAKCHHCIGEWREGERAGINDASYVRSAPEGALFLCFRHSQEQRHSDALAGLSSSA